MFKTVKGVLPWHDRTDWLWPEIDTRLNKVFTNGPNDVDDALKHIETLNIPYRTCIQAGGAMGIWAIRLAQFFDVVITIEPHPDNYHCLVHNTCDIKNISAIKAALGKEPGQVDMKLDKGERRNAGAHYIKGDGDIDQITIDSLGVDNVDLIYLDIEGSESDAILGAANTIRENRPVIGLEDKGRFYQRYGYAESAANMLIKDFNYRKLARCHLDVILAPCE